jgi:hypothetical protein
MDLYSQESEALTLPLNGQGSQTSSIASGKSSLAKSSSTNSPMQNNSETSKSSTRQLTLDELISSPEASHANRSALQEKEKEQRMNATCGKRCLELSESVNPVGSWARTFAEFVLGRTDWYSKRVALTWKLSGTPFNRLLFQLAPQTLPTDATEFGLLPTITTETGRKSDFKQGGKSMFTALNETGMLPTPNAFDWNTARTKEKWEEDKKKHKEKGVNLHMNLRQGARLMSGKASQLSPLFVEEMMGFPKNWTALPFQSGEENQSKDTETQ